MGSFIDLTNQKFSRLFVKERGPNKGRRVQWVCLCDCGKTANVDASKLRNGHTQSCGCLHIERSSEANIKHGQSAYPNKGQSTKEYNTWALMLRRCNKKNSRSYDIYGERGIKVCDEWSNFKNFFRDMGKAPSPKHSLDRIDVNGNYCPENCRWADAKTQRRNQRNPKLIECRGQKKMPIEWSEISGVSNRAIYARIKRGWSVENAIFTPMRKQRPRQPNLFRLKEIND
jgi:hypothetical protein